MSQSSAVIDQERYVHEHQELRQLWVRHTEKALAGKVNFKKERGGFTEAEGTRRKAWRQKHRPFHLTVNEVIRKYLCSIYEGISVNVK